MKLNWFENLILNKEVKLMYIYIERVPNTNLC